MLRLLLALLVLTAAGCSGSAEGAYTDGMNLETAGDYAGAADAYVLALERDRTLPNVAGRLAVAGREAIARHVATANTPDLEAAATAYLEADDLVTRAANVGVDLERPETFDRDRDDALEAAVGRAHDRARAALEAGDYAAAVEATDRARSFRPTASEAGSPDRTTADAYTRWTDAELRDGRFRSALSRADAGLAVLETDDLLDLRLAVLEAGTLVVAVFPAEGNADELFLRDLGDALVEDHLLPPPPFVGVVDPVEVRRWERRERGRRSPGLADSRRRLGDAARDVEADLGVVAVVSGIDEQTTRGRESPETATLRGSERRVTYQIRRDEIDLEGDLDVVVVDADGRLVCEERVRRSVEERVEVARYDGDWEDLDLSRSERRRFAADVRERALEAGMARLRDALSSAAADRVASCVGRQVP